MVTRETVTDRFFRSEDKERDTLWYGVAAVVVVAAAFYLTEPYHGILLDVEKMRAFIEGFGIWSPVALIALQVAQVIIAPVPGPVVGAAAGYVFGPVLGTLYGFIGLSIGSTVAILAAKKYGRPFVEDKLDPERMEWFDESASEYGFLPFFLMFLLPGFPDDAICFLAGLTEIDTRKLILMASFGRLPGLLSLTVFGDSLAAGNIKVMLAVGIAVIAVSAVAWYMRESVVKAEEKIKNPLERIKEKI